jgi:hypothetical protein
MYYWRGHHESAGTPENKTSAEQCPGRACNRVVSFSSKKKETLMFKELID